MDIEQAMRSIVLDILLLLVIPVAFGLTSATIFVSFYGGITGQPTGGTFLDFTEIGGFYFSLFFSFAAIIPHLAFKISRGIAFTLILGLLAFFAVADLSHIYFPIILGLTGYSIGLGARELLKRVYVKT